MHRGFIPVTNFEHSGLPGLWELQPLYRIKTFARRLTLESHQHPTYVRRVSTEVLCNFVSNLSNFTCKQLVRIYTWNFILDWSISLQAKSAYVWLEEVLDRIFNFREDKPWVQKVFGLILLFYFLLEYQLNNATGRVKCPAYDGLSNKLNKFSSQLKYVVAQ